MDELDLGAVRVPDSYFLPGSHRLTPYLADAIDTGAYRHCFTYRGSDESIRTAAVELIRSAERKIFLASFRIGDRPVLDALFDAANRLCGGVYVVTGWNEATLHRGFSEIEDMDDADVKAQNKRFDELTRRGIAIRGHEQCHAKFLVVDDETALVSSANLETSALADRPGKKRATGESGVVLNDPQEVGRLARFFTRMWHEGCTWEAPPGPEYAPHPREPTSWPVTVEPTTAPGVIWTYGAETGILTVLHDVISRARDELLLATYSLADVRDRPEMLLEPVRQAVVRRRLAVRLLVRARNNVPGHRADAAALADAGVVVCADSDTHAKGVIADGRHGALFSANFEAQHGLFDGVEVGVRLDGLPVLGEARRYLLHAMDHADRTFVRQPTQRQLNDGLGAFWQKRWRYGDRMQVTARPAEWRAFVRACEVGPILWEDDDGTREDGRTWEDDRTLHVYAGEGCFTVTPVAPGGFRLTAAQANQAADDRMQAWYDERRRTDRSRPGRGILPAVLQWDGA
jgi:cardiolipin synthase A/B